MMGLAKESHTLSRASQCLLLLDLTLHASNRGLLTVLHVRAVMEKLGQHLRGS